MPRSIFENELWRVFGHLRDSILLVAERPLPRRRRLQSQVGRSRLEKSGSRLFGNLFFGVGLRRNSDVADEVFVDVDVGCRRRRRQDRQNRIFSGLRVRVCFVVQSWRHSRLSGSMLLPSFVAFYHDVRRWLKCHCRNTQTWKSFNSWQICLISSQFCFVLSVMLC